MASTTFTGPVTSTNGFIGAITGLETVTTLTAASTLTTAQSNTIFFLSSATEFVTTLPAPAAGLMYTFIVGAAPSGASYTIVTTSSANIIKGQAYPASGAAGDTGTADDTINFVDGQAVAGDQVIVISDGTSWFAKAFCAAATGVTFTAT
jgi:hypothetical protein